MMLINVLIPGRRKKKSQDGGVRDHSKQSGHLAEEGNKKRGNGVHTLLPHVHVVDLPVSVLRLTDATVGKGVASVIRIHPEVEVVTGVCHGQLQERMRMKPLKQLGKFEDRNQVQNLQSSVNFEF